VKFSAGFLKIASGHKVGLLAVGLDPSAAAMYGALKGKSKEDTESKYTKIRVPASLGGWAGMGIGGGAGLVAGRAALLLTKNKKALTYVRLPKRLAKFIDPTAKKVEVPVRSNLPIVAGGMAGDAAGRYWGARKGYENVEKPKK
jgi:hypothetical protein